MITVKVNKNNEIVSNIDILGHALYDDYGKDIVCSAVSSIMITSVNAILRFDTEAISYNVDTEGMHLTINNSDNITSTLIENMIDLLRELENDYPENIKFE